MDKTYDHKKQEPQIYKQWESLGAFSPEGAKNLREKYKIPENKNKNKPYSILMPPPNANAALHCGHATYSLQDLMIRFKRMQGYDALYLPGTDHAGFETQVVYERKLKEENKSRFDFDRETLYQDVFNFVKENSEVAISQLKKVGMSADWERSTFTLDDYVIDYVYKTFEKMFKDGMVYRDGYMVNYSTFYGTTFSDLEIAHKESVSPLYYVKYNLVEDTSRYITVATVRPETIYADVAIAVNPEDKRYKDIVGKKVINPLTDKEIPIIEDEYVAIDFGTGALKITPGHDVNDYKIGKKYGLEVISLINLDGKMNENAGECVGMFAKAARTKSAEILKAKNAIEKVDDKYVNNLLIDYKEGFPIEPMILPNFFIDMDRLSTMAIKAIEEERVKFNLPEWKRDVLTWIQAKKPWPISRQTVFGIRIPVWYSVKENPEIIVTFLNASGENINGKVSDLIKAGTSLDEIKNGLQRIFAPVDAKFIVGRDAPSEDYLQETDTFDTWFSSGQWPLVTTKGPESELYKKYYPTDFLDSGYDIMFFWIARMIMFSLYLVDEVPFKSVYFHGMVTDKSGKKMSKSKGNVVNPIEVIDEYGADALRMGLLVGGNTEARLSPLDMDKIRGYRNFTNKIWNMGRFIKLKIEETGEIPLFEDGLDISNEEDNKILEEYKKVVKFVTDQYDNFHYKPAGEAIYDFIWNQIANEYLEKIKERKDTVALSVLVYIFKGSLKLLHPLMPFVTEAVYSEIPRKYNEPIIIAEFPTV